MDYNVSFHISATGMSVEKLRLDVTAMNLANLHSTSATPDGLYKPMRVVSKESPMTFSQQFGKLYALSNGGAQVVALEQAVAAPRLVHEPGHPHADANGYVSYPGVNQTSEMINMVSALRAYEANVVAMNAAKVMAARTLEIGGQG